MNQLSRATANDKNDHLSKWGVLLVTAEGKIFTSGIGLAVIGLIVMGAVALWDPATSRMIGVLAVTNVTVGRAVSMSIGYAAGYGHALVLSVNMVTETILVLLFYPIFVFSLNKLLVFKPLKYFLAQTHAAALRHRDKVMKYGVIGLFTFVWFPFWMTGPVVGSALGYLLRFPAWLTLVSVLTGTYVAMVAWALFLFDLQKKAAEMGPWVPVIIIGIFLVIAAASYLINRNNRNNGA